MATDRTGASRAFPRLKPLHLLGAVLAVAIACVVNPVAPDSSLDAGIDAGQSDSGIDAGDQDTGDQDAGIDAGDQDAGLDAGDQDAGIDAGDQDAGIDAGDQDAGIDAGDQDAGIDAGDQDAGIDAGDQDAGIDAGDQDAGIDAGTDAGDQDAGISCPAEDPWVGTYALTGGGTIDITSPVSVSEPESAIVTSYTATITETDDCNLQVAWTTTKSALDQTWIMSVSGSTATLVSATVITEMSTINGIPVDGTFQCDTGTGSLSGTTLTLACTNGVVGGTAEGFPISGTYSDSWMGSQE